MGVRAVLAAGALGLALVLLPAAGAGSGSTELVSLPNGAGLADGRSFVPALSADGRIAAFYSEASNLVTGDSNWLHDFFHPDRSSGLTTRASLSSSDVKRQRSS